METGKTKSRLTGSFGMRNCGFTIFLSVFLAYFLMVCPVGATSHEPEKIDQEAGFYYTVKKGDTLWDLSERFADSPWLWPDLWKENSQLPNPHWIYPGNRIRLYHKEWTKVMDLPTPEKPEPVYFLYRNIDLVGFIREKAVSPSAVIFKVKGDHKMLSKGDLVYLRKEKTGDFSPGRRFVVYRTFDSEINRKTGEPYGIQHYITGLVEITKEKSDFAVGTIVFSPKPIYIEDKLMPLVPRSEQIPVVDSTLGIQGNLISSEEHSEIFGDYTIAFVDKGVADGIQTGQIYQIYQQEEASLHPKTVETVKLPPYVTGELLVLRTEEHTSTVIITGATEPLSNHLKMRSMVQ
ncbi:MAG: LysM domain-containing protein [Desulfobacterales bacterium]